MPPERYTHGHHDSVLRSHRWRTSENSAAYLLPHLHPGLDLLDVGCGPGNLTVDLAGRVMPGGVVRAVDAAADVVDLARADASAGGAPADAIEWSVGDAYALDLPDGGIDVVHAHQVLQHLADPVAALREWSRVCRPDGIIAARDADYSAFTWWPGDPLLDRWLELYLFANRSNGGEPDAGRRLRHWALAADLTVTWAGASTWCLTEPADREWWGGMWAERIVSSALAEQLVSTGLASSDELRAISAAWRRWTVAPDGWFLVPHGEVLAAPG